MTKEKNSLSSLLLNLLILDKIGDVVERWKVLEEEEQL